MEKENNRQSTQNDPTHNSDYFSDNRALKINVNSRDFKRLFFTQVGNISICLLLHWVCTNTLETSAFISYFVPFLYGVLSSLVTSQKIDSVITKITAQIESMANNNFSFFELRKNDYFKKTEYSINKLEENIIQIRKQASGEILEGTHSDNKPKLTVIDGGQKKAS